MGTAREDILNKLKNAVHPEPEQPDFSTPVYHSFEQALDIEFKANMEKVNGSVYLCNSEKEVFEKLKDLLKQYEKDQIACKSPYISKQLLKQNISFSQAETVPDSIEVGITNCEFLIAHTGSVMVSSALDGGRQLFVYPPIHIVIAQKNQLADFSPITGLCLPPPSVHASTSAHDQV